MRLPLDSQWLTNAALLGALSWGGLALASTPASATVPNAGTRIHPMNAKALKEGERAPVETPHYLPPPPPPSCPGVIDNGTVQLGVAPEGHLSIPCPLSPLSSGWSGTTWVGLRYLPTVGEAAAPGTPCEGWGVADASLGVTGFSSAGCGSSSNLTVESFASSTTTATSVVRVGNSLRVTHIYTPSQVSNLLYQVDVLIENIGTTFIPDLRYTRGIDYDILPNTFSEYVTIAGAASSPWVVGSVDNNFTSLDPLAANTPIFGGTGDFTNLGPGDVGAQLDFQLGALPVGQVRAFRTFYGAAGNHFAALAALSSVGAGTYSLGKGNWNGSGSPLSAAGAPPGTFAAITGQPNTFMYGFRPPEPPTSCTVECSVLQNTPVYMTDSAGTRDLCFVNGTSLINPMGVTYINGERIEFNCGTYGSLGTLCNLVPGQDTCDAAVYQAICSSPVYAHHCL
ncbi:hypothetical protein [Myxococcus sp. Y35]|uniref:hypothetical protein n=1 Tax=Pseudomyxococcus flavus TaxID=3115648 RepID=UPI003CEB0151